MFEIYIIAQVFFQQSKKCTLQNIILKLHKNGKLLKTALQKYCKT